MRPVAAEALLTGDEFDALERQNRMWRIVRAHMDVPQNVAIWRDAGFAAADIDRLEPALAEFWDVPAERYYGWLDGDVVERIRTIDREFIARMRSTRLFGATGIRLSSPPPGDPADLNRQWQRAILRELDDDELAEFRLMNSAAAREIGRLLDGIPRTIAEERRLFQLEREFQLRHPRSLGAPADWLWREARMDHEAAIRDVLGDDAFRLYLARADFRFAAMCETLGRLGVDRPAVALELWRLRQKDDIARVRAPGRGGRAMAERDARIQGEARVLLGDGILQRYLLEEEAAWMISIRRSGRARAPGP